MSPRSRTPTARPPTGVGRFSIRRATVRDLELLVAHRRRMWEAIGGRTVDELDRADPIYRRWVRRELAARQFIGFIAETRAGEVLGSGAIWLVPSQPRPGPLGRPRMPYILSMFTEPSARGRGVAARIVRDQVRWAQARGYARVFLHASTMGRSVYARAGFVPGNEMRLDLVAGRGSRGVRRSRGRR